MMAPNLTMQDTPPADPEIEALAQLAADQVMLALDVSCERNGYGFFELDRASREQTRVWLSGSAWEGEPRYYISNTPPNVFRAERLTDAGTIGKALALHIANREGGCGIPGVTRDEALLAVIGWKRRLAE